MERLVKEGRFRADLWQRLREAEIVLPPLRERPGEIPALVEHFCKTMPGGPYTVSGPVLEVLANVSWRDGNVRELRNCLRAMTEMHVGKLLTPLAVPERVWDELGERPSGGAGTAGGAASDGEATAPAAAASAGPRDAQELVLSWDETEEHGYDYMADMLLLAMTRRLANARGRLSLRGLAQAIGVSRSTLSGRFKAMVHRNIVPIEELTRLVGVSEK
jgi:DNA-binding NtrC family response regulator